MDSPYDALGVDADADDAEIERAYRRRVKETHPDLGGSAEAFQRVREAYEAVVSGEVTPPPDRGSDADADAGGGDPVPGGGPGTRAPGNGPRGPNGGAAADEDAGDRRERADCRVEFLDYEALTDHGWSIDDPDLFEKASESDLSHEDYGVFLAEHGETLLETAEARGFHWPYACRGGACANCAVAVVQGDLEQTVDNILSDSMLEDGVRLSCIGEPVTDDMRVVYNVKHLPGLDDLRLPADRFEKARADD